MVIGFERFMTSQTAQKSSNGAVAKERTGAKTRLSRRTSMVLSTIHLQHNKERFTEVLL